MKRLNLKIKFEMEIHGMQSQSANNSSNKAIELDNNQKKALDIALKKARERKIRQFKK